MDEAGTDVDRLSPRDVVDSQEAENSKSHKDYHQQQLDEPVTLCQSE